MSTEQAVRTYVTGVAIAALAVLGVTQALPTVPFDAWAIASFLLVGCLLELSRTTGKSGGLQGSLVFIFHLAVGVVLGTFWGAVTAGSAGAISQAYQRHPPVKTVFNVSERIISVGLTFTVYHLLGGQHPPAFLLPQNVAGVVGVTAALQQLGAFLAAALVYFVVNSALVSSVVALASARPVFSTWRSNTVWVLGYDLCASLLALLIVWVYFRTTGGPLSRLGFLAVCLPIVG